MIGGQVAAETEEQRQYLDRLFHTSPVVIGTGKQDDYTPVTPVTVGRVERETPPQIVVETVEVDEEGEPIDD